MKKLLFPTAALAAVLGVVGISTGCTTTTTGAAPDGGTGAVTSGADGGTAAAGSALSCLQILQCVADCASTDAACPDACAAKGTPDAQTQVGALADCINTQMCSDATCTQTKCGPSLSACVSASAPQAQGKPLAAGDAPAQGSVPANLVGTWTHTNYGATDRIVLNADGTGSFYRGIAGGAAGCVTLDNSTETGVAVVSSDLITIYASDVTNVQKECSAPSTTTQGSPLVVQIAWNLKDPSTLVTVRVDCAEKYNNDPSSIASYCRNELTKE